MLNQIAVGYEAESTFSSHVIVVNKQDAIHESSISISINTNSRTFV